MNLEGVLTILLFWPRYYLKICILQLCSLYYSTLKTLFRHKFEMEGRGWCTVFIMDWSKVGIQLYNSV